MVVIVNMPSAASALERRFAARLEGLLGGVAWLGSWQVDTAKSDAGWDFEVSGSAPAGGAWRLCVECKSDTFRPNQFGAFAGRPCGARGAKKATRVLAVPHASERLIDLCREHGWGWFDLDGNCRLEIPGVLLIERSGNEPSRVVPRPAANLNSPEMGRVVRALLAPENAGRRWTQRGLVEHFAELPRPVPAPSLALVNKVVQHLRDEAVLEQPPTGGFRVRDYEGLLRAWRRASPANRGAQHAWFSLLRGRELDDRLAAFEADPDTRGGAMYAAFSAADLQAPAVRQPRAWLCVAPSHELALVAALDVKPVDSGENIVAVVSDDPGVFYLPDEKAGRLPCTNVVQTYLDLARAGARGEEAAEAVLAQRLRPAWARAAE